ncbi:MAG: hypothetical protein SH809_00810 [Rhodothermales bacterium]|nr:hypothetical protein [Rhodothermales bacterium]
MIYLTAQLLLFLLVSAFLGFLIGWFTRGAFADAARIQSLSSSLPVDWLHAPYPAPKLESEPGSESDEAAWHLTSDTRRS